MLNEYSHFILYAKGHYKKSILIEDLQKITANYLTCDWEDVTIPDIVSLLLKACWKYGMVETEERFSEFLNDLHPTNTWRVGYEHFDSHKDEMFSKYDFYTAIICKCLSYLRDLQVYDSKTHSIIIHIDEPDETILPLFKVA